ncbi:MAG: large conductance mechanosensitive channel [Actinomycetota bacterium]|jgi:large conductance mechanosensitive channel|nr:large conductance mechanosensitive channel [Actinomycetota bacterium]
MKAFWQEFKAFIMRGNVLDLAVAVIIGAAFKTVVDSLVNDVITPLIGAIVGQPNFSSLTLKLGKGVVNYGKFLTSVFNFLLIAAAIFVMIKTFEKLQTLRQRDAAAEVDTPAPSDETVLLTEIRDLLRERAE